MAQLNILRGDYYQFAMTLKKDGTPIDLTGKTVWFTAKKGAPSAPGDDVDDASAVIKAYWAHDGASVTGSSLLTADDDLTTGKLTLTLDSDVTTLLPADTFNYDVQVKLDVKKIRTWDTGKVQVSADLTRRTTTP